ncbi:MAG: hypothetical protein IKT01_06035 [Eubacteriaceae bacterium]|nr:hypothetical protein [Eubacteriaceae bacterium]
MARNISKSLSKILEALELDSVDYVTLDMLEKLAEEHNVGTEASMIAKRLKNAGWLLPTSNAGVWEFAPAAMAGPYSKNDPLRDIKTFKLANPETDCYLCLQTAAWALGYSDRLPSVLELAFSELPRRVISENVKTYKYKPVLPLRRVKGVDCLSPESIIVHIASKPSIVKSWESVLEWLPDVVYETETERILTELVDRNDSVKRRTGYLLQGMYPDASSAIHEKVTGKTKIRFGPRTTALRNDETWMISDTILPIVPEEMEKVK